MIDPMAHSLQDLDGAKTPDEVNLLINTMAQMGEAAVPGLIEYSKRPHIGVPRLGTLVLIFKKMGYPANENAIPFLVSQASNINSSHLNDAVSALVEIGKPAIPMIQDAFRYYSEDCDYSRYEILGLCDLLKAMEISLIAPLLSELLYLLKIGTVDNTVDEYALGPIRRIGSPTANLAIPILHMKILDQTRERMRLASLDALKYFDPSVVRPLIPIIRECILDKSEVIRARAQSVLESLGETT